MKSKVPFAGVLGQCLYLLFTAHPGQVKVLRRYPTAVPALKSKQVIRPRRSPAFGVASMQFANL